MLTGIIGCFLAVLCIGIDGRFVTPWQFLIICQARAWTMSTGFTLAFGAMFSKVWRVHRFSTKAKTDQGKVSCKLVANSNRVSQSARWYEWYLYNVILRDVSRYIPKKTIYALFNILFFAELLRSYRFSSSFSSLVTRLIFSFFTKMESSLHGLLFPHLYVPHL